MHERKPESLFQVSFANDIRKKENWAQKIWDSEIAAKYCDEAIASGLLSSTDASAVIENLKYPLQVKHPSVVVEKGIYSFNYLFYRFHSRRSS
jgi:hypothetical protein